MSETGDKKVDRVVKWLATLNEQELCQAEVLDAYFTYRSNMPENSPNFGKATAEPKTTDEIMDDLLPMMYMYKELVAAYMNAHGFGVTTMPDGSVKWAIWRYMDVSPIT